MCRQYKFASQVHDVEASCSQIYFYLIISCTEMYKKKTWILIITTADRWCQVVREKSVLELENRRFNSLQDHFCHAVVFLRFKELYSLCVSSCMMVWFRRLIGWCENLNQHNKHLWEEKSTQSCLFISCSICIELDIADSTNESISDRFINKQITWILSKSHKRSISHITGDLLQKKS